jgi:metalloendopeptidase OMA1, mitochondrial
MRTLIARVLGPCLLLLLAGCYTVPETGRSAFILPLGDEVADGALAFAELKGQEKLSTDPVANERVQRVGTRIAQAVGSDLPSAQWEFVLFDDPKTINAFALPGGKVGVYSGLLRLAKTDDSLAIVMGHEIAHVTARHGSERMSKGVAAAVLGVALSEATKDESSHDLVLAAYGIGAGGVMLKFSRDNESEADYIGIRYAAKAGYNPTAAVSFWQDMEKESKGNGLPAFLSTHPSHERRIADLQEWMPAVLPLYEAAQSRYQ